MQLWQGQTSRVPLRPGKATISLMTSAALSPPNSANRNVDAVLLSSNTTGLAIYAQHDGDAWVTCSLVFPRPSTGATPSRITPNACQRLYTSRTVVCMCV